MAAYRPPKASKGRQSDATEGIAHEFEEMVKFMGGAGLVRFIESRLCGLEFGPTREGIADLG